MNGQEFMRIIPKDNRKGNWSRYPVIFASIKSKDEKEKRLNQIKNCKTRDEINELTEPVWKAESTKEGIKQKYISSLYGRSDLYSDESKLYPVPLDTLYRLNLVYEMYKQAEFKVTDTNLEMENKICELNIWGEYEDFIIKNLRAKYRNKNDEVYYAFTLCLTGVKKLQIRSVFCSEAMKLYIKLRNSLIFPENSIIDLKNKKAYQNWNAKWKDIEGSHRNFAMIPFWQYLPGWDYLFVSKYMHRFPQLKEIQKIKICDICGLLFYGASGGDETSHNYCGVHEETEIDNFKNLHRKNKK